MFLGRSRNLVVNSFLRGNYPELRNPSEQLRWKDDSGIDLTVTMVVPVIKVVRAFDLNGEDEVGFVVSGNGDEVGPFKLLPSFSRILNIIDRPPARPRRLAAMTDLLINHIRLRLQDFISIHEEIHIPVDRREDEPDLLDL